jgi:ligand-binding SRPBCC domain-containing protein
MSIQTILREQTIDRPPDAVFPFFASPENLAIITPPWLGFRILTPLPLEVRTGTFIDYTIRWLGIPVRWRTLITEYQPSVKFVDQQIKGPYRFWHHEHAFEAVAGGTRMTDRVTYILPFGRLGDLAHRLLVRRQLEEIFDYRAASIARILEEKRI